MKRLHVHVSVPDLCAGVNFYAKLFGAEPTVRKDDYAKWTLDDPTVNFAISSRGAGAGVDHLGIETDNATELQEIADRMSEAGEVFDQGKATCCYAESEKAWVRDPHGLAWEAFHTTGESTQYGFEAQASEARIANAKAASEPKEDMIGLPSVQSSQACCEGGTEGGDCKS